MVVMRVAMIQFAAGLDSAVNRRKIAGRLESLPEDLDLVVLPEAVMHDFGDTHHDLASVAEELDGPFVSFLAEHARRLGATIVAGMFEVADDLPFNTLVVVGADGHLRARYRKVHLYDSFGYRESDRMAPGEIATTAFDLGGVRIGLMTCYDLRFPEMSRALVDDGAEVLLAPAAWLAGEHKLHHWRTLLAARAIENTAFVLAPAQGGERYTGHSLALDPMGLVLGEAGPDDDIVIVDLDPDLVGAVRDINPSLANRRMT